MTSYPRAWFVPLAADGGLRVFAFPHAGAGCAQLAAFARSAATRGLTVWSANLPGRQARLDEPARTSYSALIEELTDAICQRIDSRPYAMFGYCGGALLAFGVLRRMSGGPTPLPHRLVVASYEAPDIARRPRAVAGQPSDALWAYLRDTGGVPPGFAADARLRRVAEGAIRADFAVLAGYRHEPAPPLPVPITVCFAQHDHEVSRGALLGWRRHTTYPLDLRSVQGGHWLLDDACDDVADVVADAVSASLTGRPE